MSDRRDTRGLHDWMEAYIDGDPRAFGRLHAMLSPRLRGFLTKLVRDPATVDDLLQLTFLKAHLARDRFEVRDGDPNGAVQGWYFAISRNVALDHLRARGRKLKRTASTDEKLGMDVVADGAPSVEDAAVADEQQQETIERVRSAIAQLPPGQREVVELHKLQGMSMADIAERLQIRQGAARVRAHRGYKVLAKLLGASAWLLAAGPHATAQVWSRFWEGPL